MRTVALVLAVVAAVALVHRFATSTDAVGPVATPPPETDSRPLLGEGSEAPVFTLADQEGNDVTVGAPSSGWTLLVFYRAALSPW